MRERFDVAVVHYGEIALKGGNRPFFENMLVKNIKLALHGLDYDSVKRVSGRVLVKLGKNFDIERIKERLEKVFGIEYFSFGQECKQDVKTISNVALSNIKNKKFKKFKVDTKRSEKSFRLTSQQINEKVGALLKGKLKKKVDLEKPDLTVFVEIVHDKAFVYFEKIRGPGGLPVGVSGKAVALVSSGIDSPVAAYKAMKRGLNVVFVHFHSYPYTDRASIAKTVSLVGILNRHQFGSRVYLVPFSEVQDEIVTKAHPYLRVLLYRRFMLRIAEEIAKKEGAKALVTGESLGQVASQTLDNIHAVSAVSTMPVLRPLIGCDKNEIIGMAQDIGTYAVSIRPHSDCCSLFLPKRPATHARPEQLEKAEAALDAESLVRRSVERSEVKELKADRQ